jgi:hypothetical protein
LFDDGRKQPKEAYYKNRPNHINPDLLALYGIKEIRHVKVSEQGIDFFVVSNRIKREFKVEHFNILEAENADELLTRRSCPPVMLQRRRNSPGTRPRHPEADAGSNSGRRRDWNP